MSAPLRFLVLVVVGWGVVRATMLGAVSGFTISYAKQPARVPPVVPTQFPDLASAESVPLMGSPALSATAYPLGQTSQPTPPLRYAIPYYVPVYLSVPAPPSDAAKIPPRPVWNLPFHGATAFADYPALPSIPMLGDLAGAGLQSAQAVSTPGIVSAPAAAPRLDRWQMSSWALLRGAPVPGALASGGELGGSQAGARILYNFTRSLAASLRMTSPIGGSRGAEIAGGIRWIPLRWLPVAITAERRQSISPHGGGRSDFALFVEGGLYHRRLPLDLRLDGYAQAGVVGIRRRDPFADGQLAVTRPLFGRISAGVGLWGGYQPGLYRVDGGPRVSIKVRDNIYANVDWRQRLAGNAQPGSGPALTLGADF